VLTASDLSTYVRDNTSFLGSTGAAAIGTSVGVVGGVSTFGDLTSGGVGPAVSAVTGTKALVVVQTGLIAGTNTFTLRYYANAAPANNLIVMPLP
jgi:hypothetical protein